MGGEGRHWEESKGSPLPSYDESESKLGLSKIYVFTQGQPCQGWLGLSRLRCSHHRVTWYKAGAPIAVEGSGGQREG